MSERLFTVGEVAQMAHVTVRTLHHYDDIGLLKPSTRSDAGYRLYDEADIARLHQILLFRELEFSLEAVAELVAGSSEQRIEALQKQQALLMKRALRTKAVIGAIDVALKALRGEQEMTKHEMFNGFENFDHAQYEDEARDRWGETDAYKESQRRAKTYGEADWAKIKAESHEIMEKVAELMASGAPANSAEAMALAERHRELISRWFYPCPLQMHAGLAQMYRADERFGEFFETYAEGMTEYFARAVEANVTRQS